MRKEKKELEKRCFEYTVSVQVRCHCIQGSFVKSAAMDVYCKVIIT